MNKILLIFSLFFTLIFNGCFAIAQQYIEKQDSTFIQLHKNAGFENGKANWTFSASSTVQIVTGALALDGYSSLRFQSTAASQTVKSALLKVPPKLVGSKCQAVVSYFTFETSNPYRFEVLNASGTVVATKSLDASVIMGIPFDITLTESLEISSCPTYVQSQIISTGAAQKIDLDDNHIGSVIIIKSEEIIDELGYEPIQSVTASGGITITGSLINPVVALTPTGVASGTYAKVTVDEYGRVTSGASLTNSDLPNSGVSATTYTKVTVNSKGVVTSGSSLSESDIPFLQTTKITSGVFGVANGGTGQSSYSTGDILVASGGALVKLPVSTPGKILTISNSNYPEWMASAGGGDSGVNLITNNSFESDVTTGWVASGVTVSRQAFSSGIQNDSYYASMTATVIGAYFETSSITIPDNMRMNDVEFGGYHFNTVGAWRADYFVSGTVIASQTLSSATTWVQDPVVISPTASGQTITKVRYTNLTSGTSQLAINKVYDGSVKSISTGGIVGPWQTFTTNCTGSWVTNTSYTCRKRQIGDTMEYEYKLALTGAPTATSLYLTLPDTIDTNKLTATVDNFSLGLASITDTGTVNNEGVVFYRDTTSVNIGVNVTNATYAVLNTVTNLAPFTFANTDVIVAKFTVPIVGLQSTGTTLYSRCPNDVSCINDFHVTVSSGRALSNQSYSGAFTSCTGTSSVTCSFMSGLYTVAPYCHVTPDSAGNGAVGVRSVTTTTSSVTFDFTNQAGTAVAAPFMLSCYKVGADNVVRKNIEAFLGKTITHGANGPLRTAYANVSAAGVVTEIGADDWLNGNCAVASSTFTCTPNASIFASGSTISCQVTLGQNPPSGNSSVWGIVTQSPSSIVIGMSTPGVGNIAYGFSLTCTGPR